MVAMTRKKQLNSRIIISAVIISALLFLSGIYVGYSINREKLSSIEATINKITSEIQNFQLEFLFLDILGENATCPLLTDTLSGINKESYEIGTRLTSYGIEGVQDYNEYVSTKREYSRLLIGYWLLANKLKTSCRMEANTIVYFFSKECGKCDDQGFILTYFKKELGENLLVFALEGDLDEPSIQVIKRYYGIESYPTLIINGEVYGRFLSKSELEDILGTGQTS
jgi:thiol-disulfide isomerase/thioredoxin